MNHIRNILLLALSLTAAAGFAREAADEQVTLSVVLAADELTLDPLHSYRTTELQIATGIYEGLVSYDPESLRPVPGVAYRWDVSDDGTVYTFHLRSRARFSNGDPVTAEDFRESWLRIIDPSDEGEYSFFFDVVEGAVDYRTGVTEDPDEVGIRVVDTHTLELTLEQPASHLLSMMCHMTFSAIHRQYRESDSDSWGTSAPVISNGPYALQSWSGGSMVLSKNESYWDAWNVAIDTVKIDLTSGPQEVSGLMNDGQVDWSVTADANALENQNSVQVAPLFATSYMYFRAGEEPWSDTRVRKGLAKLVPWDAIRERTAPFATDTLVPALGFYPEVEGLHETDIEAGLELLNAAGFPGGQGLPTLTVLVIPGSIAATAARELASEWEKHIEIEVDIRAVSFRDYQQQVRAGGFAIGSSTWIGDYADPLSFLQMWTSGSRLNDAAYADDSFDDLISEASGATGEKRYETLAAAERRLLTDEVVVLPLSHTLSVNFIDLQRIDGWYPNALDVHPFKNLRFIPPKTPTWLAGITRR